MPETDKPAPLLIPKPEIERLEAFEESQGFHASKEWMGIVASFQVVICNARAEVMDMMKADIAREPLKNARQFVE